MKTAIDQNLRPEQAGLDYFGTVRIIVEQSIELYINLLDFDSVHRVTIWKIIKHCEIHEVFWQYHRK